jgi:hypothetical protein
MQKTEVLIMLLFVLAVILSAAKDPKEFCLPLPFVPFSHGLLFSAATFCLSRCVGFCISLCFNRYLSFRLSRRLFEYQNCVIGPKRSAVENPAFRFCF